MDRSEFERFGICMSTCTGQSRKSFGYKRVACFPPKTWIVGRSTDGEALEKAAEFRNEPGDYRRGYATGWEDSFLLIEDFNWSDRPPLLRRFFWWDKEDFADPLSWWRVLLLGGRDEYCNPVFGLRFIGGVMWVRWGRKVRAPMDKPCDCGMEG